MVGPSKTPVRSVQQFWHIVRLC